MVVVDSDEALLLAWRAGDTTAGQALVQRYFGVLYRFFSNKVHDGLEPERQAATAVTAFAASEELP